MSLPLRNDGVCGLLSAAGRQLCQLPLPSRLVPTRGVRGSALVERLRRGVRSALADQRVAPDARQVLSPHKASPHLPRTLARWAPTADRPVDHVGGGRCRRAAAGDPGEERRADRARAGRSWPGIKLQLLVVGVRANPRLQGHRPARGYETADGSVRRRQPSLRLAVPARGAGAGAFDQRYGVPRKPLRAVTSVLRCLSLRPFDTRPREPFHSEP